MRRESGSLPKINLTHKTSSNGENDTEKVENIEKINNEMAEVRPYTNYLKCKRLKFSKQKTKLGQMDNKQANKKLSLFL